jgi:pimeloyl-ACP methyl ester carboxylesterase
MLRNGIHYIVEGQGPPVILVHGIAASLCDWIRLVPDLTRAGHRVYALDLPGHGESEKPDDPQQYHVAVFNNKFQQWIDSLELDQAPILVGHSLGGYLSMSYSRDHPGNVAGMLLIDPFYSPQQLSLILRIARRRPAVGAKTMRLVPEWLINTLLGWDPTSAADFSPQARQQIANDYKRASPHFVYVTQEIPELTPFLHQIRTPTQVIWGTQDRTLDPDSFPRLLEALPNASGHPIPASGHQPHIGKPDLVNRIVVEFTAQILASTAPGQAG